MAFSQRPLLVAIAFAAAQRVHAQLPISSGIGNTFGEGSQPSANPFARASSANQGSGDASATQEAIRPLPQTTQSSDSDDFGSSVTETVTTKNVMGGPLTLVNTYPVSLGSEVVKTTNLLGQSTTLFLPLDTTASATPSATSPDLGPQSTYTTTDQYGHTHTIFGPASKLAPATPTPSQQSSDPSSTNPTTTGVAPGAADASTSPSSTLAQASTDSSGSSMSHGAIAAAVVVPVVVVLLLLALGLFFLLRRRRNQRRVIASNPSDESAPPMREQHRDFGATDAGAVSKGVSAAAPGSAVTSHDQRQSHLSARPDSDTSGAPVIAAAAPSQTREHPPGSSHGSIGSDPFKDPSFAPSPHERTEPVPAMPATHSYQPAAPAEPTTAAGFSTPPERPTSPQTQHLGVPETASEATTPGDERADTMRTLSPISDMEEAEIFEGRVAEVGTAHRASVVLMRGRGGSE